MNAYLIYLQEYYLYLGLIILLVSLVSKLINNEESRISQRVANPRVEGANLLFCNFLPNLQEIGQGASVATPPPNDLKS